MILPMKQVILALTITLGLLLSASAQQTLKDSSAHAASLTQVVMLGTGTPNADPDRSGRPSRSSSTGTAIWSIAVRALFDAQPPLPAMACRDWR
jgi:hypothetical protein